MRSVGARQDSPQKRGDLHTVATYTGSADGQWVFEALKRRRGHNLTTGVLSKLFLDRTAFAPRALRDTVGLFSGINELYLASTELCAEGAAVLAAWIREGASSVNPGPRPRILDVSGNGLTDASVEALGAELKKLGNPRWLIAGNASRLPPPASPCRMYAYHGCVCPSPGVLHYCRARDPPQGGPPQESPPQGSPPQGRPPQGNPPQESPPQRSAPCAPRGEAPWGGPPQRAPPPPPSPPPAPPAPPGNTTWPLASQRPPGSGPQESHKPDLVALEPLQAALAAVARARAALLEAEAARETAAAALRQDFASAPLLPGSEPRHPLAVAQTEHSACVARYVALDLEASVGAGIGIAGDGGLLGAIRLPPASAEGWVPAEAAGFPRHPLVPLAKEGFGDPRVYFHAAEGAPCEFRIKDATTDPETGVVWVAARNRSAEPGSEPPRWFPLVHCLAPQGA